MIYQLQVRKKNEDELVLGLGPAWRVVFAGLTLFMLWVVVQGGPAPLPVVLSMISLLATVYHERWVFRRGTAGIESQVGVLLLPRRRNYNPGQLRRVVLRHSSSSGPSTTALAKDSGGVLSRALEKRIVRLGIDLHPDSSPDSSGKLHGNIATESERAATRLREIGKRIADFYDVPFEEF